MVLRSVGFRNPSGSAQSRMPADGVVSCLSFSSFAGKCRARWAGWPSYPRWVGLSTTSILAAINAGAQAADKGTVSVWGAALFIIALLLFIQAQHYILITTTAEIGAIIHKMRVRLMDYVRRSELLPLE